LKGGTQLLDMNQILIGSGVIFFLGWLIPSPLSWSARRKLQAENRLLQEHLNTKMKIEAKGMSLLEQEKEYLKQMNENLRITNQTLQNKPGRSELRLLYIYDQAVNIMLARAPGFAPTWQAVLAEVEKEMQKTDQGIRAFVKKVFRPSAQLESLSTQSIRLLNRQNSEGN
jgi:hypothetical protein